MIAAQGCAANSGANVQAIGVKEIQIAPTEICSFQSTQYRLGPTIPIMINQSSHNIIGSTVLLAINYVDRESNELLSNKLFAGQVTQQDKEMITIKLEGTSPEQALFHIPTDLRAWHIAPEGDYKVPNLEAPISNPNYLITWNVYRVKPKTENDGQHEWWEWEPGDQSPQIN